MKKLLVTTLLTTLSSSAFALDQVALDATLATLTTDGTAALTSVGGAMIGLAGVAIVFKWAKAAIFG